MSIKTLKKIKSLLKRASASPSKQKIPRKTISTLNKLRKKEGIFLPLFYE